MSSENKTLDHLKLDSNTHVTAFVSHSPHVVSHLQGLHDTSLDYYTTSPDNKAFRQPVPPMPDPVRCIVVIHEHNTSKKRLADNQEFELYRSDSFNVLLQRVREAVNNGLGIDYAPVRPNTPLEIKLPTSKRQKQQEFPALTERNFRALMERVWDNAFRFAKKDKPDPDNFLVELHVWVNPAKRHLYGPSE